MPRSLVVGAIVSMALFISSAATTGGTDTTALLDVDVAIVGNGPAALLLATTLDGNLPHLNASNGGSLWQRADAALAAFAGGPDGAFWRSVRAMRAQSKGQGGTDMPLTDFDLAALAEGVGARCVNPTAAFVDKLRFPVADGGGASLLAFRAHPDRALPHVVIGAGAPGGSWHDMSASTLSLSPAHWMALPGVGAPGLQPAAVRLEPVRGRVLRARVGAYYEAYAEQVVGASAQLRGRVVRVEPPGAGGGTADVPNATMCTTGGRRWALHVEAAGGASTTTVRARAVVLATGSYDVPRRLGIPGEGLPFVGHRTPPPPAPAPAASPQRLLVVGAGLSAADAIIGWLALDGSFAAAAATREVFHVFRGAPGDQKVVKMFGGSSPGGMYGGEATLARLMRGRAHPRYTPFPRARLASIGDDGECTVVAADDDAVLARVRATAVAILIGASPDLSFLPSSIRSRLPAAPVTGLVKTNGESSSHPLHVRVDPATFEVVDDNTHEALFPGELFAVGPLRGDNFVRFVVGDAYGVARRLMARREEGGGRGGGGGGGDDA